MFQCRLSVSQLSKYTSYLYYVCAWAAETSCSSLHKAEVLIVPCSGHVNDFLSFLFFYFFLLINLFPSQPVTEKWFSVWALHLVHLFLLVLSVKICLTWLSYLHIKLPGKSFPEKCVLGLPGKTSMPWWIFPGAPECQWSDKIIKCQDLKLSQFLNFWKKKKKKACRIFWNTIKNNLAQFYIFVFIFCLTLYSITIR